MTQTIAAAADLGPANTGKVIGYRVLNLDETVYSAFSTTGVAETAISGFYRKDDGVVIPDAGGYIIWGESGTDLAEDTIPPAYALASAYTTSRANNLDNLDTTVSSRSSQTSVDVIDDFLDTEIAAILADTNELQTDWVDGGRLDLILDARASQTSVDTLDDYVDTEVAAIKAKTDNLPTDPADASDISASFSTLTTKLRKYVQLLVRKDAAIATDNATEVTEINANGGSGAGAFANTTDALEAIRDRGDAAWITADVSALATQASVDVVDANVDAILVDTNELQTDWANGGRLDNILDARASQASVDVIDDFIDTEVAAILADTNELQTDWADGGRLDLILDARASQASVDVVDTNVDAILADTGTDGVVVTAAMITAIAEAVLKQGVATVENSANEYSLAAMILAHFNSTLPEGGPWTISKVGGGTFVVRTVDEAVVSTAVTGVS